METSRLVVVTGTGTNVGKTHVCCALLHEARRRGIVARGLKPIESGVSPQVVSDAARLGTAAGVPAVEPRYALVDAVSPHLAARREGVRIEVDAVVSWVAERARSSWTLVELPGGLLSPLAVGVSCLDAVLALAPGHVVLVGSDALGTLHHVAASLRVLASEGVSNVKVVLSAPAVPDLSTGTNAAELAAVGVVQDVLSFERGDAEYLGDVSAALLSRIGWM